MARTFSMLVLLVAMLAASAFTVAESADTQTTAAAASITPPPMLVTAWNYTPDANATKVRKMLTAYITFQGADKSKPDWWVSRWDRRRLVFYVDDVEVSAKLAASRLRECPAISWVHPFHTAWMDGAPPQFSPEDYSGHVGLIRSALSQLRAAGMTESELSRINHIVDFENDGPHTFSKFADLDGKLRDQPHSADVPHLATACYLFGQAMREVGWRQSGGAAIANYSTNHTATKTDLGLPPYFRPTPYHVPGSASGTVTFVSGYVFGGPNGCLTEAEMLDAIARAPAPIWLALEDNNPGLLRILRAAKSSGKVRIVALWGNGKSNASLGDTGDRHREFAAGGSREWASKQDSAIAEAVK